MFNNKKNNIQLNEDEKLIIIRSLDKYCDELKQIMSNPEVSKNDLLFICTSSYFNLVDCVKRKLND